MIGKMKQYGRMLEHNQFYPPRFTAEELARYLSKHAQVSIMDLFN